MSLDVKGRKEYMIGNGESTGGAGTISCANCEDDNVYWLPIVQGSLVPGKSDQFYWLDDRPSQNGSRVLNSSWMISQPNGLESQQCVESIPTPSGQSFWNDQTCTFTKFFICEIPKYQTYYLRGQNMGKFDREYTLSLDLQNSQTEIEFVGKGKSSVIWYPMEDRAVLRPQNHNLTVAIHQNPFGLLSANNLKGPQIPAANSSQPMVLTNVILTTLLYKAVYFSKFDFVDSYFSVIRRRVSHVGMANAFQWTIVVTILMIVRTKVMNTCAGTSN